MRLLSLFFAVVALAVVADVASATVIRQRIVAPRRAVVVQQVVQPVVVRQRLVAPLAVVQPVYSHAVVQQVVQPVYAAPVQQVQQVQQYAAPVLQVVQPVVVRPRLQLVSPYCQ